MADQDAQFKLMIGDMIEADRGDQRGDIEEAELNLTELDYKTVDILVTILRENRLSEPQEFQVLGERLYAVLFRKSDGTENPIGVALRDAINERPDVLRLELQFKGKRGREIEHWPWEYLYRPGDDYLAGRPNIVLNRRLRLLENPRPFSVDDVPVQILFIAVSPKEVAPGPLDLPSAPRHALGQVQWRNVWDELELLARDSRGEIEVMGYIADGHEIEVKGGLSLRTGAPASRKAPEPSHLDRTAFVTLLNHWQPHVVHFVGHGECPEGLGQLAFVDERGAPQWVDQNALARLMEPLRDLRLVFLQACESALKVRSDPYLAVSGVATALATKGIPAVVGMNYRVQNAVANLFAKEMYLALGARECLDVAVQRGRLAVQDDFQEWAQQRGFALPVLYTRERAPLLKGTAPLAGGTTVVPPDQVRPPEQQPSYPCQRCEKAMPESALFCGRCGQGFTCKGCGERVPESFCLKCGLPFIPDARDGFDDAAPRAAA